MKRLTDKRLAIPPGQWQEVTREEARELKEIPVPPMRDLYYRLSQIEDILGDDYDLDRLRELVKADRDDRCVTLPFRPPKTVYSCNKCFPEPQRAHYASAINILWDMDRGYVFGDTREAAEAALKARGKDG